MQLLQNFNARNSSEKFDRKSIRPYTKRQRTLLKGDIVPLTAPPINTPASNLRLFHQPNVRLFEFNFVSNLYVCHLILYIFFL